MLNRRDCFPALAGLALAGCSRSQKRTIAVIPKATSHMFWLTVQQGAIDAGREFNVDIQWNGPASETDFSRQIQIVDSMVSQRVDGIAVAAADRKALVTPIERATAANIPVTVFDSGLDTSQYVSYVATDNVEAGRVAARALIQLSGGKGKVGILMHAPGSASTMDREKGFSEALAAEAPGMQIVASQYGMSDRSKARAAAENILTAHPDLTGMFASSEPSSVGASLAIQGRELTKKVVLVAFDASDTMIEDLRTGAIDAMIVQDAYRMGFEAVKTLVDKLNGKTPPRRVDLHAAVVHLKDLNEPEVKRLLNLK